MAFLTFYGTFKHPRTQSLPILFTLFFILGLLTSLHIFNNSSQTMTIEKLGIKIVKNPPESQLTELGVKSWPKWGCPPSKFPWTFSTNETCYLLKGKVNVSVDGSDGTVEIGAGDLVVFPKGMSVTWDVLEAVDKHYNCE